MTRFTFSPAPFLEFTDETELARVRSLSREQFLHSPHEALRISTLSDRDSLYRACAEDIVGEIRAAREHDHGLVLILPAGPMPQYHAAARLINDLDLSLDHVEFFAMDEWADQDGVSAPGEWAGSFQHALRSQFFSRVDAQLRPREDQMHFPSSATIEDYGRRIADLGGADVCYGGIGWNGHMAFWEPQLGHEFAGDLDAYRAASSRVVDLHPLTVAQNALTSFGGDWSIVPPRAVTIGPAEIMGARRRSFWLDGDLGGGVTWQAFIARLVAHGPVNEFVPGSLLQTARSELTVLDGIAQPPSILIN